MRRECLNRFVDTGQKERVSSVQTGPDRLCGAWLLRAWKPLGELCQEAFTRPVLTSLLRRNVSRSQQVGGCRVVRAAAVIAVIVVFLAVCFAEINARLAVCVRIILFSASIVANTVVSTVGIALVSYLHKIFFFFCPRCSTFRPGPRFPSSGISASHLPRRHFRHFHRRARMPRHQARIGVDVRRRLQVGLRHAPTQLRTPPESVRRAFFLFVAFP